MMGDELMLEISKDGLMSSQCFEIVALEKECGEMMKWKELLRGECKHAKFKRDPKANIT